MREIFANIERKKAEGEVIYSEGESSSVRVDEEGLYTLGMKLNIN